MIKNAFTIYRQIHATIEYRKVFENFSFLSALQIGTYVLPLVTIPYLASVLSSDSFGLIMFAQAFVQYFLLITDYGFNYSATRDIALHREDANKVSEIFCSVIFIKTALFGSSFVILLIITSFVDRFAEHRLVYLLTFGSALSSVLFPVWFFQGLQKMRYITLVNLGAKLLSVVLILSFVKHSDHFLRVPLIYASSSVVPVFFVLPHLKKIFPLTLLVPSKRSLLIQLRGGWYIFLSSIASSLYSTSNTVIIGLLFNHAYAGYYAFAEKIIRASTSLIVPLNNAIFPLMSVKMKNAPAEARKIFRRILEIIIVLSALGTITIFFGSSLLALVNPEFSASIEVLRILSPLCIILSVSNLIGFQILYTNNLERRFLTTVIIAGLLNLLFCVSLSGAFLYNSAAISLLISELFICISFIWFSRRILA